MKNSTDHPFISLVECINNVLNSRNIMIGTYVDLQKAFDIVNHKCSPKQAYAYGVRDNIILWLKSYINHIIHDVVINNSKLRL